jgi:hypothetical protein
MRKSTRRNNQLINNIFSTKLIPVQKQNFTLKGEYMSLVLNDFEIEPHIFSLVSLIYLNLLLFDVFSLVNILLQIDIIYLLFMPTHTQTLSFILGKLKYVSNNTTFHKSL